MRRAQKKKETKEREEPGSFELRGLDTGERLIKPGLAALVSFMQTCRVRPLRFIMTDGVRRDWSVLWLATSETTFDESNRRYIFRNEYPFSLSSAELLFTTASIIEPGHFVRLSVRNTGKAPSRFLVSFLLERVE